MIDDIIKNNGLFLRERIKGDVAFKIVSLNKEDSFLGGEETFLMEWLDGNNHFQCIIYQQKEIFGSDRFQFYFPLENKIVKFMNDLFLMCLNFTNNSWKNALKDYPNIYYFAHYSFSHQSKPFSDLFGGYYYDECNMKSSKFHNGEGLKFAKCISSKLFGMMKELHDFTLDMTSLQRNKPLIDTTKIPAWVKYAVAISGIITIKLIIRSVGSDIEVELPNDNSTSDVEFNSTDYSVCISSDNEDHNQDYSSITFQGKTQDSLPSNSDSDGKIPAGDITLTTSGGNTKKFKLFKDGGKKFVLYYGQYIELKDNSVDIGNMKFLLK